MACPQGLPNRKEKGEKRAVVLLSGGVDSSTVLAYAIAQGFRCYALTFDYGQRSKFEISSAVKVARKLGAAEHLVFKLDLGAFGGSSLVGEGDVPRFQKARKEGVIPTTYVPARNIIFLAVALAWAESLGAGDIFIGVNSIDCPGYPDCTPGFMEAFQAVVDKGTRAGVIGETIRINAPFVEMRKSEILMVGKSLGVDYSMTTSCYDPDRRGRPCGGCESCLLRRDAFERAGISDPLSER